MRKTVIIAVAALALCSLAFGQPYKAALGAIPGTEPLAKMLEAMGKQAKVEFAIQSTPMERMIQSILGKQADLGLPMIALKDPEKIKNLPFDYSTDKISGMAFVLYTNSTKPIDLKDLKNGNSKGYKIESDVSNMDKFSFATLPSTNPEGSLKKVEEGRIDGYIFGQASSDPVLKALKLTKVRRQLYETYDIVFALQKGARGGDLDKALSEGLKKIRASGEFDKIMGETVRQGVYDDWQP